MKTDCITNKREFAISAVVFVIAIGIIARFLVMAWGHNYDFESYKIVGEIVSKGGNIYAETHRYNYAFVFSIIQGLGFRIFGAYEELFRVYIVGILTLADVGIMLWINNRYNYKMGMLFFLNPISIIITGYHNQFDNIAVLFALIASSYFDEDSESLTKNDFIAIAFLTLSMLTKHVLFMFLLWIFFRKNKVGFTKKVAYSLIPMIVFLISFIPYVIGNEAAFTGVIKHVFLYRSYNNYPLLSYLLKLIMLPNRFYFIVYLILMIVLGVAYREKSFGDMLLLYFVCMVAFSSAIANQYLIIPIVTLIVYRKNCLLYLYEIIGTIYCLLNGNELHLKNAVISRIPQLSDFVNLLSKEGGIAITMMTVVLVLFLILVKTKNANCIVVNLNKV